MLERQLAVERFASGEGGLRGAAGDATGGQKVQNAAEGNIKEGDGGKQTFELEVEVHVQRVNLYFYF